MPVITVGPRTPDGGLCFEARHPATDDPQATVLVRIWLTARRIPFVQPPPGPRGVSMTARVPAAHVESFLSRWMPEPRDAFPEGHRTPYRHGPGPRASNVVVFPARHGGR